MENEKELLQEVKDLKGKVQLISNMVYGYIIATCTPEEIEKFKKVVEDISPESSDTIPN